MAGSRGGFTIVEIIVVFILIGILTSILVPVIANRANDARIAAALSDVEALANAQERFQIDVGYFVRMHALNDVTFEGDGIPNADIDNVIDSIFDNGGATQQDDTYINPEVLFISPATQDYVGPNQQDSILGDETSFAGNGPYINWQRMRDINNNDWPDDPWGNDYMLFTRVGVIVPTSKQRVENEDRTGSQNNDEGWDDLSFQFEEEGPEAHDPSGNGLNRAIDIFDRPVILSLGPNGLPGNGGDDQNDPENYYGRGDDIVRAFGGARSGFNRLGGTGL